MAAFAGTGGPISLMLTPEVMRKLNRELMMMTGDVVNSARDLSEWNFNGYRMDPKTPRIDFDDYTRRGQAVADNFMASLVNAAKKQMPTPASDAFRFMDLPIELRMMVYDLLLTARGDIYVNRAASKKVSKETFMPVARFAVATGQAPDHPGSWFLRSYQIFEARNRVPTLQVTVLGLTLGLLTASQLISAEATKRLYRNNTFVFWHTPALQMLGKMVSPVSLCGIRHVQLREFDLIRDKNILELFVNTSGVQTLDLTIECRFLRPYLYKRDGTLKAANETVPFPQTRRDVLDHLWHCIKPFVVGKHEPLFRLSERQRRLGLITFRLGPTILEHWGPPQPNSRDLTAEEDSALRAYLDWEMKF